MTTHKFPLPSGGSLVNGERRADASPAVVDLAAITSRILFSGSLTVR